jgi:hypothetical protein
LDARCTYVRVAAPASDSDAPPRSSTDVSDVIGRPAAALLSTLSLWMAGTLGVSITAMRPMLATMLYGVAATGGDWDILLESEYDDDSDPEGLS